MLMKANFLYLSYARTEHASARLGRVARAALGQVLQSGHALHGLLHPVSDAICAALRLSCLELLALNLNLLPGSLLCLLRRLSGPRALTRLRLASANDSRLQARALVVNLLLECDLAWWHFLSALLGDHQLQMALTMDTSLFSPRVAFVELDSCTFARLSSHDVCVHQCGPADRVACRKLLL